MSGSGTAMPPTRKTGAGSLEAQMSMPEDLESLPTKDVGAFIERFAHAHTVSGEQPCTHERAMSACRRALQRQSGSSVLGRCRRR